jgi:alpha-galactosidase
MLMVLFIASQVQSLENGLGLTPQMGWNSWNYFGCNINETVFKTAADLLVSTGLSELGYKYVNIDDCWPLRNRSDLGSIIPDPVKFPNGISGLAEYIHSLGLKLGIYSDAGLTTCQGYPGSLYHEYPDAEQFASWGVDYLKYDNCDNTGVPATQRYPPMRDALNATNRKIFYSICNWGQEAPWNWGPSTGNSWRTTPDIKDGWISMVTNFYENSLHATSASPGAWNDPDMLEVGNGGMTYAEYKTHFSLWAIVKAPLIIGCNLNTISNQTLSILSNRDVISINQDPLGKQAKCVRGCNYANYISGIEFNVFVGNLYNGDFVVSVTNFGVYSQSANYTLNELGLPGKGIIKELWDKTVVTSSNIVVTDLAKHSVKIYRITPINSTEYYYD